MKRRVLILVIFTVAGGFLWSDHRQRAHIVTERDRLRADVEQIKRRSIDLGAEVSLLEVEVKARERLLVDRRDQITVDADAMRHTVARASFGPPGGIPNWSERESFVWIKKEHIAALGISAFRPNDRVYTEVPMETAQALNRIHRQLLDAHPELAEGASLSPEKLAEMKAEYERLLSVATGGLDAKSRLELAGEIGQVGDALSPGGETQPSVGYRLNKSAAALLGMTPAERGEVERLTHSMTERYHELERRRVSVSKDHVGWGGNAKQGLGTFKVAAFPGEGGMLKAEWQAQLKVALGAERVQHLLEMSAKWIHSDLGDFGEAERTITFREGAGYTDVSNKGYYASVGTGGPPPIPAGWQHLIARPAYGGLPQLRSPE